MQRTASGTSGITSTYAYASTATAGNELLSLTASGTAPAGSYGYDNNGNLFMSMTRPSNSGVLQARHDHHSRRGSSGAGSTSRRSARSLARLHRRFNPLAAIADVDVSLAAQRPVRRRCGRRACMDTD